MSAVDAVRALLGGRIIAFSAPLARALGSNDAAILLQQLSYWCERSADGWATRTQDDITDETNLSRYEQERCRKVLRDLDILDERRFGVPARLWFSVDFERVAALLMDAHSRMRETRTLVAEKPTIQCASFPHPLLNTLSDTTNDNTAAPLPPNEDGGGGFVETISHDERERLATFDRDMTDALPHIHTSKPERPTVPTTAPPPNGDDTGRPADPLQAIRYEILIGRDIWRSIVADMRACNVELGAEWLRATLAFMPNHLTQATLLETFERVHIIATEAKTRDDASPPGYKMRNWRQWMRSRLQETAKEVLAGD